MVIDFLEAITMIDSAKKKIGVLDSGVGGLTVVRQLQELLPGEDILYFGDSANVPYGNKEKPEILRLMNNILDFMEENEVKAIAVACNTLSTLYDVYAPQRKTKIFSIVAAGAQSVIDLGLKEVGIVATDFTIKTGWYKKLIQEQDPTVTVYGAGNHMLATLLDSGRFDEVPENVTANMADLAKQGQPSHVILGCTHYPIVRDQFEACAPGVTFIDPALEMAKAMKNWLEKEDLLQEKGRHTLDIRTSGNPEYYGVMCDMLGIQRPDSLERKILGK